MRIGNASIKGQQQSVAEKDGVWFRLDQSIESVLSGQALRDPIETIPEPLDFALTHIPRQIICVGRNYAAHAKELGNEVPTSPLLFNKLPSTCIPHGAAIEFPESLGRVDYEGEIGVVIGKDSYKVSRADAYDHILGYTLLNDVTARDQQSQAKEKGHPWLMAKNHATFCPLGPTITLKESVPWPLELDIQLTINGEIRQSGNSRDFLFDIPTLIEHITARFALFPGDIIATGTPEGVAALTHNDTVEISAPGLGTLRNRVIITS